MPSKFARKALKETPKEIIEQIIKLHKMEKGIFKIERDWLPFTEPKPLEGYQKWYCLDQRTISIFYAKIKPSDKSVVKYYSEQEAIELGLTI